MGGTNYSDRIIEDADRVLEALKTFFHANGAEVKGLVNRNGHRRKEVGEEKSVIWGGERTNSEGCECKLAKNMFFHRDLLQLCLNKN